MIPECHRDARLEQDCSRLTHSHDRLHAACHVCVVGLALPLTYTNIQNRSSAQNDAQSSGHHAGQVYSGLWQHHTMMCEGRHQITALTSSSIEDLEASAGIMHCGITVVPTDSSPVTVHLAMLQVSWPLQRVRQECAAVPPAYPRHRVERSPSCGGRVGDGHVELRPDRSDERLGEGQQQQHFLPDRSEVFASEGAGPCRHWAYALLQLQC